MVPTGAPRTTRKRPTVSAIATSSPTTMCSGPTAASTPTRTAVRPVRHVPRAAGPLRLARRVHVPRVRHRHTRRSATPDRARRQAGGRGRPVGRRRTAPARARHRLEPGRVRGARAVVRRPRRPARRTGPPAPPTLDGGVRDVRRPFPHRQRRWARAAARGRRHPGLARRHGPTGPATGRAGGRRLVPPGPTGRRPRRGARDHRRGRSRRRPRPGRHRVRRPDTSRRPIPTGPATTPTAGGWPAPATSP